MKKLLLIVVAIAIASAARAGQARVDLTGKWLFTVQTSAGGGTPTVKLKQEGDKLTGHYSSSQLGEAELTGTVTGNTMKLTFGVEVQGTHLDVVYTGTIEGKDSMKGTVSLGVAGDGTFTAKRQ